MSEWQAYRIADLGQVITGRTPATNRPELLGNGTAFVTPTDISEQSIYAEPQRRLSSTGDAEFRRVILPPDSVCFTCIASIGKMCLTSEPTLTNQQINSLIVDHSRVVPRWAFYALKAMREEISAIASGAATPIINKTSFGNIQLLVPPLETQRRIASILGAYDDLIEVNRRRIAVLEEMARGLFEEWFVRFRFPDHEAVPILDTPDGPLPEGWTWEPFSALADFINGFAFKPSHFEDEGLPIVKIPELKNGVSTKTPRNSGRDVPQRLHIKDGYLLFSWSGTFAISEWTCGDALLNQHLFLVTPKREWGRGFIKEALIGALPKFDNQGVGATMKHIRRSALDQTMVAIPSSLPIINQANGFFDAQYAQLVALRQSNQRLAASRDLLLPRLISGQLSVAEAERQLEEAA